MTTQDAETRTWCIEQDPLKRPFELSLLGIPNETAYASQAQAPSVLLDKIDTVMTMVEAKNCAEVCHRFGSLGGFPSWCRAGIEHPLVWLWGEEISAQDSRLVLDGKPPLPITLELDKRGMRYD
jgi:hypothetical protein